ncbi:MAG: flagellar hook-basal body complex protein FliE [Methanothrix sp.]|nr:flagellar hook-basal body complex protein FliE [Methanothrix sp.]
MKIIGFVGLPGSGKSEASQVARQRGLAVLVMGDIIRHEAARQGLEPTDQNLGRVGTALRAAEGPDAVAKRTLEKAMALGEDIVVIDGLRSKDEADFFRASVEEFHLIEISAPVEARLKWLESRGRPDDPDQKAADALELRECRELSWGMCEAMKAADLKLKNEGRLDDFRKNVERLLEVLGTTTTSEKMINCAFQEPLFH